MKHTERMRFRDLKINQCFDWVGGEYPSFFRPCRKSGDFTYVDELLNEYRVGTINAIVYHVEEL